MIVARGVRKSCEIDDNRVERNRSVPDDIRAASAADRKRSRSMPKAIRRAAAINASRVGLVGGVRSKWSVPT